jgi:hypothetical protein
MTAAETIPIGISFAARLGVGETVGSSPAPTITLTNLETGVSAAASLSGAASVASPVVTQTITGLTADTDYELAVTATIAGASPARRETVLHIVECV